MIAIVANKSDILIDVAVTEEEGRNFATSIGASFHSISCLKGLGIQEMMQEIGEQYIKVKDSIGKEIKGMKINEEEKKDTIVEKKKSLCSML